MTTEMNRRYQNDYTAGYLRALLDIEELLSNSIKNGGGIDAGNGKFIPNAHWNYEIQDQLDLLKEKFGA